MLIENGPQQFLVVACKATATLEACVIKPFKGLTAAYGAAALKNGTVDYRTDQPYPLTEQGTERALLLGGAAGMCRWLSGLV